MHGSVGMMTKARPKSNYLGSINPSSRSIIRPQLLALNNRTWATLGILRIPARLNIYFNRADRSAGADPALLPLSADAV